MFERLRKKIVRLMGGGIIIAHTQLTVRKKELGSNGQYHYTDERRVVKDRVITDAFVQFLVDQLQAETSEIGDFKYHDSGTGTNAESASDTGLQTPCGESRDAGTQTEGDNANTYKSVATHTYAGTFAITEHGIFSQATGGTLMDRTKFSAINVVSGNQIEFTFEITFSSGG